MKNSSIPPEGSKYHVPNLERALAIIELLSENPEGLAITDIAEQLSFPKNSVFRISLTLLNHGYLQRDEEVKKFTLSRKLLAIGFTALNEQNLVEKSIPIMRELRDAIKETVLIGVLQGNEGVVLDQVPGLHSFRFMFEPGRRFHLHTSAPGKAMLAFLPKKERDNIVDKLTMERYNEQTITDKNVFREHLEQVKKCGYAFDDAEENECVHCVGSPILDKTDYPIAAIWVAGPSNRMRSVDFEKIGKLTRQTANRISQTLGYYENSLIQ